MVQEKGEMERKETDKMTEGDRAEVTSDARERRRERNSLNGLFARLWQQQERQRRTQKNEEEQDETPTKQDTMAA